MSATTITDVVAWWGGIVATAVLVWDIIKWKMTGPKIKLECSSNLEMLGDPKFEHMTLAQVTARNVGDRATTIESAHITYYENNRIRKKNKPAKQFLITNYATAYTMPYEIKPGGVWRGIIEQTPDITQMAKQGLLFFEVYYSDSDKPVKVRLFIS